MKLFSPQQQQQRQQRKTACSISNATSGKKFFTRCRLQRKLCKVDASGTGEVEEEARKFQMCTHKYRRAAHI